MKHHHKLLIALSIGIAIMETAQAQVEQPIIISEYQGAEGKTPLAQVDITVFNAGTTQSDPEGKALLRFRTLHAGDRVVLKRIEKAGYEIFNSQAIEQWSISPQRPFQIILCRSDRFKALRDQYSRVAHASYARQYEAEKARLAAERKKTHMQEESYQKQLTALENQYLQQLEDLENYVDQFARIDLSELNERQRGLIHLVQEGKIDEAIRAYESADYQAQYRQQSADIERIDQAQTRLTEAKEQKRIERKKIHNAIGRQIATYRLAGGRQNFDKVTALLKSVADADTTYLDAVKDYADHALYQNLADEYEKYYHIIIRGSKDSLSIQAKCWHMLAQGYMLQANYAMAESAYLKALQINDSLVRQNPERYTPLLFDNQHLLMAYYLWIGNIEKGLQIGKEAERSVNFLIEQEREDCQNGFISFYSIQSLLLCTIGDSVQALTMVDKACSLARDLFQKEPDNIEAIIKPLTSKTQVCYMLQRWADAIEVLTEQIAIEENFYNKNPEARLPFLQSEYNNLADCYLHVQQYEDCEKHLQRSEQLLSEMIVKDGLPHALDKANLYDISIRLYLQKGDQEKAKNYYHAIQEAWSLMSPEEKQVTEEMFTELGELMSGNK